MNYYVAGIPVSDELYHHGIKGQKWGIRRYQNEDGSLTEAGLRRYGSVRGIQKELNKIDKQMAYTVGDKTKNIVRAERKSRGRSLNNDTYDIDDKYIKKDKEIAKKYEDLSSKKEQLIKNAIEKGFDVRVKTIPRPTTSTKEVVAKMLLAYATLGIYTPKITTAVYGNEYSVRKAK